MARTRASDRLWRLGYPIEDRTGMGQVLGLISALGAKTLSNGPFVQPVHAFK